MERTSLLLIEDDDGYARLVEEHLEQIRPGQYDLLHVPRLSTGLERLLRGGIDVVLLDLTLPDSRGLDTYVQVRSQAPEIPVVVLTGLDDEELAVQAAREGAQDYLVKGRVRGDSLVRCLQYAVERQQALVKLRRYARQASASENRFRRIIEQNADGIIITDPTGDVLFVNRAALQMLDEPADDVLGRPFRFGLVPGKTSEVMLGDNAIVAEMRVVETRWDGDNALLASLRDVTEHERNRELRARLETQALLVEELGDLERMKSDFVRTITAEFLVPLEPLGLAVDSLLDEAQGALNERQRDVLERVREEVGKVARFAAGVQTLSRLDSGEYTVSPRSVVLGDIIDNAFAGLGARAAQRDIELTVDVDPEVVVFADPDEVARILGQLVDNAVGHNPPGTSVRVTGSRVAEDQVEIRVSDSGRGIPGAAREHVFDRFGPAGSGSLDMGIGLALCKALVERMGGLLSVESRVGEGSTFCFTLPAKLT